VCSTWCESCDRRTIVALEVVVPLALALDGGAAIFTCVAMVELGRGDTCH
jgi:hypothetical protein